MVDYLIFSAVIIPIIVYIIYTKDKFKTKLILPFSFIFILFFWEIYQIATLGFVKYKILKNDIYYYSLIQGASPEILPLDRLISKIDLFSNQFGIRNEGIIIIFTILAIYCIHLFLRGLEEKPCLMFYVSFIGISTIGWFLFINLTYIRHILPSIILGIPLFANLIFELFERVKCSNGIKRLVSLLMFAVILLFLIVSIPHIITNDISDYENQSILLETQNAFIKEVETIPNNSIIGYWWWNAPEISYFVNNDFVELRNTTTMGSSQTLKKIPDFVIVPRHLISHDKKSLEELTPFLGDTIFKECDLNKNCYYLYKYRSSNINFNTNRS